LVFLVAPAAPAILAPVFLTNPAEPGVIATSPTNAWRPTLEGAATAGEGTGVTDAGRGDGAALQCTGCAVAAPPAAPAGRPELRVVLEVTMSLQGSHFVACRNGRSAAGLKLADTDGDAEREQAPTIPPVELIPDASTDSSPTARDTGGSSTGAFAEHDGDSISEWLPPAAAAD
jgi:hypothetical protein